MRACLIDVDGHNFSNLALMRLSAGLKKDGLDVEWYDESKHYDIAFCSKIFSDTYTKDVDESKIKADRIIKGGTGYCIKTVNGKEVFDCSKNENLPEYFENMFPDYSIYPQYNYAVAMTSRGCPRGCGFCHVGRKEGLKAYKVANLDRFYSGQPEIQVLDPNITACPDKRELFDQYKQVCRPRKGAMVEFNQGLDIRLIDSYDIEDLNHMRVKRLHFAWDNPKEDLKPYFEEFSKGYKRKSNKGLVFVLTNFNSTMKENLYRIYTLRDLGFDPYVMIYNKPEASKEIHHLQRWCNNKIIFKSCSKFEDYLSK